MATIYELRVRSSMGIFAVPCRGGRRGKPLRLPDGAIVEEPPPDQRPGPAETPEEAMPVGSGGVPATIHHLNLGLVAGYVPLSGVYLLPSGEVAAVYGAEVHPLGVESEIAP